MSTPYRFTDEYRKAARKAAAQRAAMRWQRGDLSNVPTPGAVVIRGRKYG